LYYGSLLNILFESILLLFFWNIVDLAFASLYIYFFTIYLFNFFWGIL